MAVKRYDKRNKIKNKKYKEKYQEKKQHNNYVVWGTIIVLVFFAYFIYQFLLLPQIDLNGKKSIVLNYKDKYVEKGYEASFMGNDVTDFVKVDGNVNSKKIGTYKITYKVEVDGFVKQVVRKVKVKDKEEPVIKENSDTMFVCPGDSVNVGKIKAFDNYDGDISDKVEVDIREDEIIYKVKDSFGNKKKIIKPIKYIDIGKPEIKLKDGKEVFVYRDEKYNDAGYEVIDNCDSKLNKKVKVEGKVDTSKTGTYILNYYVADNSGNVGKVQRRVNVVEKDEKGVIYLTFDDGPKSGVTDAILTILYEEGVKATFFVTGKGPDGLIERAYKDGHTVALHTFSHDYSKVYASEDDYFKDLDEVSDRVERITGEKSKIIRFPGGSSNTISRRYSPGIMSTLTKEVVDRGYKYYDWNISSGDAEIGVNNPEEIRDNVIYNLSKERANMVLLHDIKGYTRDALREIIRYGKDNGYRFEKITMNTKMVTQRVNN